MKKKLGHCVCCALFESFKPGSGYCHKNPPVIVHHLVKEDEEGAVRYSSILNSSVSPITLDRAFCGDFLSSEDVDYLG